jgi:hypothetical protein
MNVVPALSSTVAVSWTGGPWRPGGGGSGSAGLRVVDVLAGDWRLAAPWPPGAAAAPAMPIAVPAAPAATTIAPARSVLVRRLRMIPSLSLWARGSVP